MSKKRDYKKRILRAGMIVLLVTFVISAGLLFLELWDRGQGRFPSVTPEETFFQYNGEDYVLKEYVETFLLLGLDKFEDAETGDSYNNDKQADFLMLFVFDNEQKTCSAIQVNRDTMANVNVLGVDGSRIDTVTKQIALSHTYGNGRDMSCRNTADAVSDLLEDIRVDHYVSMTMDGVAILNDAVGGVEVTVLDDFTGIDASLVKGKTVTLNGAQALRYVRTRRGLEDSTNITRMKRQQQYMNALYNRFMDSMAQDEEFIVDTSLEIADYVVSDRSPTQLQELAKKFREYEFTGIRTLEGEVKKGEKFMEFYPDENEIRKLVAELFYQPK